MENVSDTWSGLHPAFFCLAAQTGNGRSWQLFPLCFNRQAWHLWSPLTLLLSLTCLETG